MGSLYLATVYWYYRAPSKSADNSLNTRLFVTKTDQLCDSYHTTSRTKQCLLLALVLFLHHAILHSTNMYMYLFMTDPNVELLFFSIVRHIQVSGHPFSEKLGTLSISRCNTELLYLQFSFQYACVMYSVWRYTYLLSDIDCNKWIDTENDPL